MKAGFDMAAIGAILGWWFDFYSHNIGAVATTISAAYYAYQIYCKWKDRH